MRKLVPLKSIYAFVAVAELGSMSEAAQHLSVSHSAVSQAIKSLETQLGVVLFRRVGRRVELNAQGRKYYRKVAPALTQIVEASESIARQTHSLRLTVNMVHSLALHWWIPNVAEFQAYAPHIDVRISNILGVFDLDHEGVDVALLHGLPDEWQGDYCEKLGDDALIMVCSPHLLEGLKNTNIDDSQGVIQDDSQQDIAYLPTALLAQYPAIFATHPRRQKDWEVWCQAHGVAVPEQQKNLSFHASIHAVQAAIRRLGVLITHQQFVKDDIKHGMLVQVGEAVLNPHQAFYWICAKEKLKDEGVLTLRHWLREQFQP